MSIASAFPADTNKIESEVLKHEYVNNGDKGYNFAQVLQPLIFFLFYF